MVRAVGITVSSPGLHSLSASARPSPRSSSGWASPRAAHTQKIEHCWSPSATRLRRCFLLDRRRDRPRLFAGVAELVVAAIVVTTPTKSLSGYLSGRAYALTPRRSMRVGLGMVTRGEFSLIIAAVALTGAGASLINRCDFRPLRQLATHPPMSALDADAFSSALRGVATARFGADNDDNEGRTC